MAINLNETINIQYTKFIGYQNNIFYTNKYFSYKYDNIHVFDYQISCTIDDPLLPISIYKLTNTGMEAANITDINNFTTNLQKLTKDDDIRFIFIGVILMATSGNHANSLIFDKYDNSFELFEPHGKLSGPVSVNPLTIYRKLERTLRTYINYNIFHEPLSFCPRYSFQTFDSTKYPNFQGEGFCMAWSLWYVETRINNENKTRDEIIQIALTNLQQKNGDFTAFIGNYSSFISYIKDNIQDCEKKITCTTDNLFFSIILQFYNLIDFNILLFGQYTSNMKDIMKKIINNCGYSHLVQLCNVIHETKCALNFSNYSIRKALKLVIKKNDDLTNCQLYAAFIGSYYDHEYSAYCLKGTDYFSDLKATIVCPYNILIIENLLDNMTISYVNLTRDQKCAKLYDAFSSGIIANINITSDIYKQYGYLLLLLDKFSLEMYVKSLNMMHLYNFNNYFHILRTLLSNFKNLNMPVSEVVNVKKIILLHNYDLFLKRFLAK